MYVMREIMGPTGTGFGLKNEAFVRITFRSKCLHDLHLSCFSNERDLCGSSKNYFLLFIPVCLQPRKSLLPNITNILCLPRREGRKGDTSSSRISLSNLSCMRLIMYDFSTAEVELVYFFRLLLNIRIFQRILQLDLTEVLAKNLHKTFTLITETYHVSVL
jgi:hypothetical protein